MDQHFLIIPIIIVIIVVHIMHAMSPEPLVSQRLDQALSLPPPQRAALFFCLEASMAAPSPPAGGQPAPAVGGHPPVPAVGGHPPVPAVGAHPPVPAAGGPNIPAWDPAWAQEEINHFRTLEDWGCLTQLLNQKLCTTPRRALSAHTTTHCQPRKADGPAAGSLKDAGINNMLPAVGGQVFVRVNLPHAFPMGIVSLSHMKAQQKKTPRRFRTRLAWSCCATW